ncbi:MAG TPA: FHA domain-containing protein [Pyrinomonadaceae bacterium]|jgi:ABC-type multidrug transport system ATPase subunit/pSer/pThr/pTyr-binding forkhead associated (FHA) protein
MKIVLSEESNGQQKPERVYERNVVKIGRDPAECQVVFNQTEWPMVSRRHAEIRLKDGRYLLVDTNSSFGTFLDGQRITEPVEIREGARAQFGAGGPIMRVVRIEQEQARPQPAVDFADMETRRDLLPGEQPAPAAPPAAPKPSPPQPKAVPQQPPPPAAQQGAPRQAAPPPPPPAAPSQPAFVEIVRSATGQLERIQVTKDVTLLGRDPATDVAIEASAAVVSRRHAEIQRRDGQFILVDKGSFNGTLLNDQRITTPTPLYDGDRIQLGMGGPILRFVAPSHPAPAGAQHAGQRAVAGAGAPAGAPPAPISGPLAEVAGMHTMVVKSGSGSLQPQKPAAGGGAAGGAAQPQLLMQLGFNGKQQLTIGRAPDNDIHLDGLQISNHHARLLNSGGQIIIEDVGSTNGVYVNGARITGRRPVQNRDIVQVGPFVLQADPQRGVAVFDTRSKTRIDVIDITKEVPNRSGGGMIKLLDDVDLTIQPNEFVGLLGPSGAGKSTLMDSLNGMRPATAGHVLINNLDLYQHLDSLKQSIGYVPQDDIIHRELTVYRTLYYVARLRLSRDVSTQEIDQIVGEVMDVTGLSERRDVPVGQLSGGQRKRVSIAVELITKPSVIFLDEPTSGLDPATEEKIMKLFRQIAESGRTVILTTHAMENVKLFDKIVVMMRGKLVFYGAPQEALAHVQADSFKDLYDKLEAPVEEQIAKMPPLPPNATKEQKAAFKKQKEQIAESVAEEWKRRFQRTPQYQRNIVQPLSGLKRDAPVVAPAKRRPTVTDALRQWATLARRYMEVLGRDRFNLLILFGQAPIVAFLLYLVVGHDVPRDFPFFVLALVAVWFGTSVAAREIIRERAVYNRERMVNLGLLPYVGSKLFVLSLIVGVQCVLLFGTVKLFDLAGMMKLQGYLFGLPQLIIMIVTGIVGIALGLFVSAVVKTSEMATSLVPLILIPQILFSGLVGVPTGFSKVVGLVMPATWAFDEMKQLSGLDTLREEGSVKNGANEGRGLYKHIEDLNKENIDRARRDIENYKKVAEDNQADFEKKMNDYVARLRQGDTSAVQPEAPKLGDAPTVPEAEKIPDDLSNYVDFLHPWGHVLLNPIVLLIMFFTLIAATIVALRSQDIG